MRVLREEAPDEDCDGEQDDGVDVTQPVPGGHLDERHVLALEGRSLLLRQLGYLRVLLHAAQPVDTAAPARRPPARV